MRRGRGELLMMIMIDFQFECLIIHVNESKSSGDNQVWEIITMIIPQLKAYHTSPHHPTTTRAALLLYYLLTEMHSCLTLDAAGLVKLTETI